MPWAISNSQLLFRPVISFSLQGASTLKMILNCSALIRQKTEIGGIHSKIMNHCNHSLTSSLSFKRSQKRIKEYPSKNHCTCFCHKMRENGLTTSKLKASTRPTAKIRWRRATLELMSWFQSEDLRSLKRKGITSMSNSERKLGKGSFQRIKKIENPSQRKLTTS